MKQLLGNKKAWIGLLILFALAFPMLVGNSGYFMTLFVLACVYVIAAMALNLLVGFGGQISVGNAAFLVIGGYTVAILAGKYNLPIWLLLPLAGVVTGVIGLVIGLPAVRLSGHFLAVATLGFGLSVPQIVLNWDSVTNGYSGLSVARPAFLSSDIQFFYVVVLITLLIVWIMGNIVKSGMGRAFVAIRDSEVAAQANGIHIAFYKTMMFVISAFFTGIAGGLYAYWIGFVSPDDFSIVTSLMLLAMIVVGGMASIPGAIIGAVLFTIIPHFTNAFVGITNIVIGLAVVLVLFFRPKGIVSLFDFAKKPQVEQEPSEPASASGTVKGVARDVNL
ncbi:branched-chain amino acid ABC transporter permease [Sporosarcina sp. 179-K 3D1 HS]|uniref:branched-chain amino acid ABC transporter permease n=1 Tax=Sporosarcina sp. 179-K 3D1 HS TaxID=3232169 RepID=UPI00399FA537